MNEERLHRLLSGVGEPERPTTAEWQAFLNRARRNRTTRMVFSALLTVALVAVSAVALSRYSTKRTDVPPAEQDQIVPVPIPEDPPESCSEGPSLESGSLGFVAYAGVTDLHIVDVETGHDQILVSGGSGFGRGFPGSGVQVSPDGRWITFGDGLVVPSGGGTVCAPLGRGLRDFRWTSGGMLVGLGDNVLVVGGPDRQPKTFDAGRFPIGSYALSPDGKSIAVSVFSPPDKTNDPLSVGMRGIWVLDLEGRVVGRPSTISLPGPEYKIAAWAPDGRSILYWVLFPNSASLNADGGPLHVVDISTGDRTEVSPGMPNDPGQVSMCGGSVVIADVPGRFAEQGHVITVLDPADWSSQPLPGEAGESYVDPSCNRDGAGRIVATAAPGVQGSLGEVEKETSIVWLEPDSGEVVDRTFVEGRISRFPLLMPDGQVIFEARERGAPEGGLYIHGTDGQVTLLVDHVRVDEYPYLGGVRFWDWHRP